MNFKIKMPDNCSFQIIGVSLWGRSGDVNELHFYQYRNNDETAVESFKSWSSCDAGELPTPEFMVANGIHQFVESVEYGWAEIFKVEIGVVRYNLRGEIESHESIVHLFHDIVSPDKCYSTHTVGIVPNEYSSFTDAHNLAIPLAAKLIAQWMKDVLIKELDKCRSQNQ